MNTNPYEPTAPRINHADQSKLAAQIAAMMVGLRMGLLPNTRGHIRSGVTKNKMRPRNKHRAKMARESRRRNAVR